MKGADFGEAVAGGIDGGEASAALRGPGYGARGTGGPHAQVFRRAAGKLAKIDRGVLHSRGLP